MISGAQGTVPSPSYRVDAVILDAPREGQTVRVTGLGLETQEGSTAQASRLSAYLSQDAFLEIATTPQIRVFRVQGASSLVHGTAPVSREAGPGPGGGLAFRSETAQTVEVAMPYLNGWNSGASEFSGRLRVEARAQASTQLRYTPPLFLPGLMIALLGLVGAAWLLAKPANVAALLKTSRDEGK